MRFTQKKCAVVNACHFCRRQDVLDVQELISKRLNFVIYKRISMRFEISEPAGDKEVEITAFDQNPRWRMQTGGTDNTVIFVSDSTFCDCF
jgi:hypothetical protein